MYICKEHRTFLTTTVLISHCDNQNQTLLTERIYDLATMRAEHRASQQQEKHSDINYLFLRQGQTCTFEAAHELAARDAISLALCCRPSNLVLILCIVLFHRSHILRKKLSKSRCWRVASPRNRRRFLLLIIDQRIHNSCCCCCICCRVLKSFCDILDMFLLGISDNRVADSARPALSRLHMRKMRAIEVDLIEFVPIPLHFRIAVKRCLLFVELLLQLAHKLPNLFIFKRAPRQRIEEFVCVHALLLLVATIVGHERALQTVIDSILQHQSLLFDGFILLRRGTGNCAVLCQCAFAFSEHLSNFFDSIEHLCLNFYLLFRLAVINRNAH
mmetsp:Transcript_6623/g.9189  ORF Transcript_6623/g.9189 Transcript_6623/m.9189 type:complete len:330 (+) Transcript_6623:108-1097(+)